MSTNEVNSLITEHIYRQIAFGTSYPLNIVKQKKKNDIKKLTEKPLSLNESVKVLNVILFMYVIVDDVMHLLLFINKTLEPLLRYPVHSLTFTSFFQLH